MLGLYHFIALGLFTAFAGVDLVSRARRYPAVARRRLKRIAFT